MAPQEATTAEPPEQAQGVGQRRLVTAPKDKWPRAGALGAHLEDARGVEGDEGASSAADGVDVEGGQRDRVFGDLARPVEPPSPPTGSKATSVLVPPMSSVMIGPRPASCAARAAPTTPPAGPLSTTRRLRRQLHGAAGALQHRESQVLEASLEPGEVRAHHRTSAAFTKAVDQRSNSRCRPSREALVVDGSPERAEWSSDSLLEVRVRVSVQEADGDALDPAALDPPCEALELLRRGRAVPLHAAIDWPGLHARDLVPIARAARGAGRTGWRAEPGRSCRRSRSGRGSFAVTPGHARAVAREEGVESDRGTDDLGPGSGNEAPDPSRIASSAPPAWRGPSTRGPFALLQDQVREGAAGVHTEALGLGRGRVYAGALYAMLLDHGDRGRSRVPAGLGAVRPRPREDPCRGRPTLRWQREHRGHEHDPRGRQADRPARLRARRGQGRGAGARAAGRPRGRGLRRRRGRGRRGHQALSLWASRAARALRPWWGRPRPRPPAPARRRIARVATLALTRFVSLASILMTAAFAVGAAVRFGVQDQRTLAFGVLAVLVLCFTGPTSAASSRAASRERSAAVRTHRHRDGDLRGGFPWLTSRSSSSATAPGARRSRCASPATASPRGSGAGTLSAPRRSWSAVRTVARLARRRAARGALLHRRSARGQRRRDPGSFPSSQRSTCARPSCASRRPRRRGPGRAPPRASRSSPSDADPDPDRRARRAAHLRPHRSEPRRGAGQGLPALLVACSEDLDLAERVQAAPPRRASAFTPTGTYEAPSWLPPSRT